MAPANGAEEGPEVGDLGLGDAQTKRRPDWERRNGCPAIRNTQTLQKMEPTHSTSGKALAPTAAKQIATTITVLKSR
jgi:hypothetical protein